MSPLQEGVVKAVIVAASLGAGGTVLTNTITNATQNQKIETNSEDIRSLEKMREVINKIATDVAVIEERTRHD